MVWSYLEQIRFRSRLPEDGLRWRLPTGWAGRRRLEISSGGDRGRVLLLPPRDELLQVLFNLGTRNGALCNHASVRARGPISTLPALSYHGYHIHM